MKIESSLRGIFTAFFRQFWKFFFTFVIIVGSASYYVTTTTPVYESSGSILVKFGNDAQLDVSKNNQNQPELTPNDRRELVESYVKILQSHDLLISLINEFGANKLYPQSQLMTEMAPDNAAEAAYNKLVKGDLTVRSGIQSNIIDLRVQNSNPQLASQFLKRLLEQFITRQSDVFNRPETDFINEQVKHASDELQVAQKALQAFKAKNGLSSVEEEMNRLLQEKSEAKNVALRSIDEAQTKVDELRSKETQLMMSYQHDSPALLKIRESLGMAQRQLAMKQADLKAGTIEGGADNASTLAPHIKDIDKRMKLLETQRGEYNDLARQVQISEDNYKTYVAKLEDARVKTTLNQQNITRISVLDEPTRPLTPIKPNKLFIVVLSIIGGIVLALGMVMAFEGLDERFSKPEQITAALGIPVIASYPIMRKRRGRANHG